MKIIIDIPKEFEEEFNRDKFEDSLSRVASDIESFGFQLAGRYEQETIKMLREAVKNGKPLPKHHGRLIDEQQIIDRFKPVEKFEYWRIGLDGLVNVLSDAPTIIEGSESE